MQDFSLLFPLALFGLIFGSFISALSYRSVIGLSILRGRSICPKCKKTISWKDNIPVVSFVLLKGKSRCCNKLISLRYPLIELMTMVCFLITGMVYLNCTAYSSPVCSLRLILGFWTIPYLLIILIFLITSIVTDSEHKIIVDSNIFIPYSLALLVLILVNPDYAYANIFLSFASGLFFLMVHLFTKGKGMGLGDVKLVLLPPLILGWPYTITWLFTSFITGALFGVILILLGKAKFGKQIPFGPFLIISYLLVLFWGEKLSFIFRF